jgi:hypothetical protein
MPKSSFIRFVHNADIVHKTYVTNDTGQRLPTWSTKYNNTPCFATPAGFRASIRTSPTVEQSDWITMFLPINIEISYDSRVRDIKYKNITMYSGLYEIHQIDPAPGFTGKPIYYAVTLKSVIE